MSLSSWLWCMFQIDETASTYLYYVHDIIRSNNYTPVNKGWTSELFPLGSDDIALHLEISDQIRSKPIQPKDAMRAALKRQLNHKNPNENLLDLSMSTFCGLIRATNDGDHFLVEIESREFGWTTRICAVSGSECEYNLFAPYTCQEWRWPFLGRNRVRESSWTISFSSSWTLVLK